MKRRAPRYDRVYSESELRGLGFFTPPKGFLPMVNTPTTVDALDGAIEMLKAIRSGKQYTLGEYNDRLRAYEAARDEHRRLENIDRRNREAIRSMAQQRREA